MSKRLGEIIHCKYKTSSRHLVKVRSSPMVVALGENYNVGEKPTVIILFKEKSEPSEILVAIRGHQTKTKQKQCSTTVLST